MVQRLTMLRRARDSRGFTLIELLVVIVVLGVLSAIVVFAVRGTGDKGELAAARSDAKAVRTAQEVYCAKFGTYAPDQATLVAPPGGGGGFLSEKSKLHDVVLTSGTCGGVGFALTCNPMNSTCGNDGTTPDGDFAGAASPGGTWSRGSDGLTSSPSSADGITLASGKVLSVYLSPGASGYVPKAAVYDPATASWTATSAIPAPNLDLFQQQPSPWSLVLLEGTAAECGTLCGQVLYRFMNVENSSSPTPAGQRGVHFKLFDPVAFEDPALPDWRNVIDPPFTVGNSLTTVTGGFDLLRCARATPTSDCGKVLLVGGGDTSNVGANIPADSIPTTRRTALFDPTQDPSTVAVWTRGPDAARVYQSGYRTVTMPNGGVLAITSGVTATGPSAAGAETYDPVAHTWTPTATKPQDLAHCTRTSLAPVLRNLAYSTVIPLAGTTKVVVAGGLGSTFCNSAQTTGPSPVLSEAETRQSQIVFNSATNSWSTLPGLCGCSNGKTVVLPAIYGSKVLVVPQLGPQSGAGLIPGPSNAWLRPASLFDPTTQTWADAGSSQLLWRTVFGLSALKTGKVLITPGGEGTSATNRTYLYSPPIPKP